MAVRVAALDNVVLTEDVEHLARYAADRAKRSSLGAASFHKSYKIGAYNFEVRGGGDYTTVFVTVGGEHAIKHPSGVVVVYYSRGGFGFFDSLDSAFEFSVETAGALYSLKGRNYKAALPFLYKCLDDVYPVIPEQPLFVFHNTLESALNATRSMVFPEAVELLHQCWSFFSGTYHDFQKDEIVYLDALKRFDIEEFFSIKVARFINDGHEVLAAFAREMVDECLRLFFYHLRKTNKAFARLYERSLNRKYGFEYTGIAPHAEYPSLGGGAWFDIDVYAVYPVKELDLGANPSKKYYLFEGVPFVFYIIAEATEGYHGPRFSLYPLGFRELLPEPETKPEQLFPEGFAFRDGWSDLVHYGGGFNGNASYVFSTFMKVDELEFDPMTQTHLVDGSAVIGNSVFRITAQIWTDLVSIYTDPYYRAVGKVPFPILSRYEAPPDSLWYVPFSSLPSYNIDRVRPLYEWVSGLIASETVYEPNGWGGPISASYRPRIFKHWFSRDYIEAGVVFGTSNPYSGSKGQPGSFSDVYFRGHPKRDLRDMAGYTTVNDECAVDPETTSEHLFTVGAVTSDEDGNLCIAPFYLCEHPTHNQTKIMWFYHGATRSDRACAIWHRDVTLPDIERSGDESLMDLYLDGKLEHPDVSRATIEYKVRKFVFPFAQGRRYPGVKLDVNKDVAPKTEANIVHMPAFGFDIDEKAKFSGKFSIGEKHFTSTIFKDFKTDSLSVRSGYPYYMYYMYHNTSMRWAGELVMRQENVLYPTTTIDMDLRYRYYYVFFVFSRCDRKYFFTLGYSQDVVGEFDVRRSALYTISDFSYEYDLKHSLYSEYTIEYEVNPNTSIVSFEVETNAWTAFEGNDWLPKRVDTIGVGDDMRVRGDVKLSVQGKHLTDKNDHSICARAYKFDFTSHNKLFVTGKFVDYVLYFTAGSKFLAFYKQLVQRLMLPSLSNPDMFVVTSGAFKFDVADSVSIQQINARSIDYVYYRDVISSGKFVDSSNRTFKVRNILPSFHPRQDTSFYVKHICERNYYGPIFNPEYVAKAHGRKILGPDGSRLVFVAEDKSDNFTNDLIVEVRSESLLLVFMHLIYGTPIDKKKFEKTPLMDFRSSEDWPPKKSVFVRTGKELLQRFQRGAYVYGTATDIRNSKLADKVFMDRVNVALGLDVVKYFNMHNFFSIPPSASGKSVISYSGVCNEEPEELGNPPVTGAANFVIDGYEEFLLCLKKEDDHYVIRDLDGSERMKDLVFDPLCTVSRFGSNGIVPIPKYQSSSDTLILFDWDMYHTPPFFKRDVLYHSRTCFWDPFGVLK